MAVILVTYDLNRPGQNYQAVHDYLKKFTYCKGMESVWLLDTQQSTEAVRDGLSRIVDSTDTLFVVRLQQTWNSWNYTCADWLNAPGRSW